MTLIAIGGAEDKQGGMAVLRRVLAESGLANPRICVITTASAEPEAAKERYQKAFGALGIACDVAHVSTRKQAGAASIVEKVSQADIIFFSGGDQLRLTSILGGTAMMEAVKQRYATGQLLIAGTSAGAAAASALMICGGDPEKAMIKGNVPMTAGLGFLDGVVFDTHFGERHRLARLFNAVATNPGVMGIGLDEDTAVVVKNDGVMEVVGKGTVTIVDGRDMNYSNFAEVEMGKRFDIDGVHVHTLTAGEKFRLSDRKKLSL